MDLPNQTELLTLFSAYLKEAGLSAVSVKNYLSDLRHFLNFCEIYSTSSSNSGTSATTKEIFELLPKFLSTYVQEQTSTLTPKNTTNRRMASIRRFATFLKVKYDVQSIFSEQSISNTFTNTTHVRPEIRQSDHFNSTDQTVSPLSSVPSENTGSITPAANTLSSAKILEQFKSALEKEKKSRSTIKNYLSDLNHFFLWTANQTPYTAQNLVNILSEPQLQAYITYLKLSHTSTSVINRRQSSIKKLAKFCFTREYIQENPFELKPAPPALAPLAWIERLAHRPKKAPKTVKKGFALIVDRYNGLPWAPYLNIALLVLATTAMAIFAYNQVILRARQGSAATALTPPRRQLSFQGRLTDSGGTPITTAVSVVFKLFNQLAPPGTQLYTSGTCSIDPDQNGIFNTLIGDGVCGAEITQSVFTDNRDVFLEIQVGSETLTPRQQIATVGYALNSETLQGYPASAAATINTVPVIDNNGDINIALTSPSIISTSGVFTLTGQSMALTTAANSGGDIILQPDALGSGQVLVLGGTSAEDTLRVTNANLTTGALISGYVGSDANTGRLLSLTAGSAELDRFWVATNGVTSIQTATESALTALIVNQKGTGDLITASTSGVAKFTVTRDGNVDITGTYLVNGSPLSGSNWQRTSGSLAPLNITDSINIGAVATNSAFVHLAGTSGENSFVNTGNFGIGLTNPTYGLDVNATAAFKNTARFLGTVTQAAQTLDRIDIGVEAGTPRMVFENSGFSIWQIDNDSGTFRWFIPGLEQMNLTTSANYPTLTLKNGSTSRIVLNTNGSSYFTGGSVAIGATNPLTKLMLTDSTNPKAFLLGFRQSTDNTYGFDISLEQQSVGRLDFDTLNASTRATAMSIMRVTGLVGVGTNAPDARLEINHATGDNLRLTYNDADGSATAYSDFSLASDGDLTIDSAGGAVSLASGDDFNLTAAGDLIFGGATSLAETTAANDSGAYLVGTFDEFDNSSSANVQDVLDDLDAAITSASSGGGPWLENAGTLYPKNSTVDLFVGGQATSSAKFAILNVNSGTPTASISGTTTGAALYMTGEGSISTTQNRSLLLNPTGGNVGIGITNPAYKLDVTGDINITGAIRDNGSAGISGQILSSTGTGIEWIAAPVDTSGPWSWTAGVIYPAVISDSVNLGNAATNSATVHLSGVSSVDSFIQNSQFGIGLTNPAYDLDINGNMHLTGIFYDSNGEAGTTGQVLSTTGTATDWVDATVAPGSTQYWQENAGVLSPVNWYDSLAIGGTSTASAMFYANAISGDASMSGNLTIGYNKQIRSAYGPLYLAYKSAADTWTNGITLQDTTGNVGIGTTTPGYKLDVTGTGHITGNVTLDSLTADRLVVTDANKNLVSSITSANMAASITNETGTGLVVFNDSPVFTTQIVTPVVIGSTSANGALTLEGNNTTGNTATNANLIFKVGDSAGTTAMTILNNGNVGVGTTTPDRKLDVLDATNPQLRLTQADGTVYADFQMNSDGDLIVNVDGVTNQLVLDNGGSVGIGTTTPAQKLDIVGNVQFSGALMPNGAAGNAGEFLTSAGAGAPPTWTSTVPASSVPFSGITGATNTTAAMVVGTGASLTVSGSGTINATTLLGATWAAPGTIGSGTPNTGAFTTLSASGLLSANADLSVTGYATVSASLAVGYTNAPAGPGSAIFSGNVGIGITNPAYNLDITGDINITGALRDNGSAGSSGQILSSTGTGIQWIDNNTVVQYWQRTSGSLAPLYITDSLNLGATATGSATVHLSGTTGDTSFFKNGVALGFTTPITSIPSHTTMLEVAGDINPNADASYDIGRTGAAWQNIYLASGIHDSAGVEIISTSNRRLANGMWNINDGIRVGDTTQSFPNGEKLYVTGNATITGSLTTGSLGIGTTAPTSDFDIAGNASTSGTFSFRGTTDPKINVLNGENFGIQTSVGGDTGLTERFTILNTGNVGIGITNPAYKLDVTGTTHITSTVTLDSLTADRLVVTDGSKNLVSSITSANMAASITNETGTGLAVFNDSPAFTTQIVSPVVIGSTSANGTLTLEGNNTTGNTAGNANLIFKVGDSAGTTAMTILNNGSIGIGTTTPFTGLTGYNGLEVITTGNNLPRGLLTTQYSTDANSAILGSRKARGSAGSLTTVVNGDTLFTFYPQAYDGANWVNPGLFGWLSNGTVATNSIPSDFVLYTGAVSGGSERMRITSAGDVGFGITNPGAKVDIVGNSTNTASAFYALQVSGAQSTANTASHIGGNFIPTYTAASGNTLANLSGVRSIPSNTNTGTVTALYGINSLPTNSSSGTVTSLYGLSGVPQKTGTGAVTSAYGVYARVDNDNATGTISNAYGVYIGDSGETGTITNDYGLYQNDTTADNYFAGSVGIGITNPSVLLTVGNGSGADGALFSTGTGQFTVQTARTSGVNSQITWEPSTTANGTSYGLNLTAVNLTTGSNLYYGLYIQDPADNGAGTSTGLNLVGTNWDVDVTMQNGETIDNNTNGQITLSTGIGTTTNGVYIDSGNNATTNGLCQGGTNSNTSLSNIQIVACSAAPTSDYSEIYPTKPDVVYGDIVAISPQTTIIRRVQSDESGNVLDPISQPINILQKSLQPYQTNVVGIASQNWTDFTSAGHNSVKDEDHPLPIALNGRVVLNISNSSAPIKAGDQITTSVDPGKGMKALQSGRIVGTALEDWSPNNNQTQILVFVDNSYHDPDIAINDSGDVSLHGDSLADNFTVTTPTGSTSKIGAFAQATVAYLKAGSAVVTDLIAQNLTVRGKLISPIADIDQLKVIDATVSGTLYANNIKSGTIDALTGQLDLLNNKYSTASAILADLQAKYGTYDSLLSTSTATSSSDPLALSPLATTSATVPYDLALNSLDVQTILTGDILASGSIFSSSLSSLDTDLFIQPLGDKPVHLLANLMTLYPDGKVVVNGDLLVTGTLYANSLDTKTATVSGTLALGRGELASDSGKLIALFNDQGQVVGSVDSSGSASFGQLTTDGLVIAAGNDTSSATVSAQANSNATIGTAGIATGSAEIFIGNNKVTDNTLVYITPISNTDNQVLYVKSKQSGIGFTVATPQVTTNEIFFNYWLVQTK